MSGIRQDVSFAVRHMRRSPGFAATAVLTLTLGIAANIIVFGRAKKAVGFLEHMKVGVPVTLATVLFAVGVRWLLNYPR